MIDTLAEIADDLASKIAGATGDGDDLVIISTTPGAIVALGSVKQYRKTAYVLETATLDIVNGAARQHYLRAAIQLAGDYSSGETWTVTINGVTFTYKTENDLAEASRTLSYIADKLIIEINKSATFKAVRGGDSTAPGGDLALPQIIVIDKSVDPRLSQAGDDPFTFDISRGGGRLDALFDIDRSTIVGGSIPVPVALPLPSWLLASTASSASRCRPSPTRSTTSRARSSS